MMMGGRGIRLRRGGLGVGVGVGVCSLWLPSVSSTRLRRFGDAARCAVHPEELMELSRSSLPDAVGSVSSFRGIPFAQGMGRR